MGLILDTKGSQHVVQPGQSACGGPAGLAKPSESGRSDIYVIGGAAMTLAYDARRATRDIDAVFQPLGVVLEEARAVAVELGLPPGG